VNEYPFSIRRARFGEYEVDLVTGELCNNGSKVILPEQLLKILAMLLERPGDLVTREEIEKNVWPDTHVDPELSRNQALKRLRAALGDDSEKPRYIETIRKKGYRFIASVEVLADGSAGNHAQLASAQDAFEVELREIGAQLIKATSLQELNPLRHRALVLLLQHREHPRLYEARTLYDKIAAAIFYFVLQPPRRITFETAALIFNDRSALSIQDRYGESRWQTIGTIGDSIILVVNHTLHQKDGKEIIQITGARKATLQERRAYEQLRKKSD